MKTFIEAIRAAYIGLKESGQVRPDGEQRMQTLAVAIEQAEAQADAEAPAQADPIEVQLRGIHDQIEGLQLAVIAAIDNKA